MTRPLVASLALLALPAVASAQVVVRPFGPPILGGRAVIGPPIASGANALFPVQQAVPPRFVNGGGSLSVPPPLLLPSGPWGGVNYPFPVQPVVIERVATPAATTPAATTPLSDLPGQAVATLIAEFPASTEVWVNGKKVDGDPATEWTLKSPELAVGTSHTFEVKARWTTGGKTFEASRSVAVAAGSRDRWVVVSGTEIRK